MAKNLSNLRAPRKANTGRKRVGRGMGSGMGKTSARGHKGQGSRTGTSLMRGFEGGQMPLHRRLPKRGFTNIFRTEYTVINLDRIVQQTEGRSITEIALEDYKKLGLVSSKKALVKILGSGELTAAITIHATSSPSPQLKRLRKPAARLWFWVRLRQLRSWRNSAPMLPHGHMAARGPEGSSYKPSRLKLAHESPILMRDV